MPVCAVSCCKNRSRTSSLKKDGVTFHLFPKDSNRQKMWTEACHNEPTWKPTRTSTICSKHFLPSTFTATPRSRRLCSNAVPTLFLEKEKVESIPMRVISEISATSSNNPCEESNIVVTPRKRKLMRRLNYKNMKIRKLTYQNKKLTKKVANLKEIIETLKEKSLLDTESSVLLQHIGVQSKELLNRQFLKSKTGKVPNQKYSSELRCFALTLNYYSPKAYMYVRKVFSTCLPAPRTLRRWYSCIDGKPGFTQEALQVLKLRAEANKEKKIFCALVIDEMKIKTFTEWDRNSQRNFGYVDNGFDFQSDCSEKATEALVLLLVGINTTWKVPIGYFLINKINAQRKAWLVTQAIQLVSDTGVEIKALTCDGTKVNLAMAAELGCDLDPENLRTSFLDPVTGLTICFFLDPCHMLKLIRNALEAYGNFQHPNGGFIRWQHIEILHKLQEQELFFLANKLRANHIYFKSKIMNVRLAAQLFSASVADAIIFCKNILKYEEFNNAEETAEFLRLVNDLFDVLDSRTRQYGLKRALNAGNYDTVLEILNKAKYTLMNLTTRVKNRKGIEKEVNVLKSPRFTGFLGFCVCIESTKTLYRDLVQNSSSNLTYLPLHKISQDHIEILFGNIRHHGGSNDNPTARQFEAIYKKILVHCELLEPRGGNSVALEKITILNCSSSVDRINITSSKMKCYDENDIVITQWIESSDELEEIESYTCLSPFGEKVIDYVGAFVVHSLVKKLKCDTCVSALLGEIDEKSLTFQKNRGRLIYPSEDVKRLCKQSEIQLRRGIDGRSLKPQYTTQLIMAKTLSNFVGKKIFEEINFHMFHNDSVNHVIELAKSVIKLYIDTRISFLRKESDPKKCVRQIYRKLIQAKGQ